MLVSGVLTSFATPVALKPSFFFLSVTSTSEIYTLSLHDALPIYTANSAHWGASCPRQGRLLPPIGSNIDIDRKSTRLNSSHQIISYAVFCLKKKMSRLLTIEEACHVCR